jgi:hypothetical protein
MKKAALTIAIAFVLLVGLALRPASAQGPVPLSYEIRCFLEDVTDFTGGNPPAVQLADITWHESTLRKQYVCPECGYSSGQAGTCPNLWQIPGHGANVALVNLGSGGSTQRSRVISIPEWDMPLAGTNTGYPQYDLMWYNYATGQPVYRAVVGIPFCPETGTGGQAFDPPDPRGFGKTLHILAVINLPNQGVDIDGDGNPDIKQNARFRVVVLNPTWPCVPPPVDQNDAETRGWVSNKPVSAAASGIIQDQSFTPPAIPAGDYGIGRVYLEWNNPGGGPGNPWYFDHTPAGAAITPMGAAFFCSRLQVPTQWQLGVAPSAVDTWRNGGGAGVVGPIEYHGAYNANKQTYDEQNSSYLARILIGPLTGTLRDDLFMPGATTLRRPFGVINRDNTKMIEHLEMTPLQGMVTAPGLRAAGRGTVRPSLPESALLMGPTTTGQGAVAPQAIDTGHWVQARIPAYQPASEPGATLGHTPSNNWGYRGLQLLYNDLNGDHLWNLSLSANLDQSSDTVEEYAPFDVQVSVDRAARLMADTGTAETGRVAPGVFSAAPDTTVGTPPAGRFPYPCNVAPTDSFTVSNEGNVVSPVALLSTNQATAEPVGVSPKYRSLGRYLAGNPVWLPLAAYTALGTSSLPAGWSGSAGGWGTGGLAGMGTPANPLPLGQGSGQYSSQVVYFLDLNGNGQLDFINGLSGAVTTTASSFYDARRDEPLEPVTYVPTELRVTESRLPYNDYYAADTEPTLRFDYGSGTTNLQVMWVSNRYSVAMGGGTVNTAAPATTTPAQAAEPTFPGNVLYANATWALVSGAPDYRPYTWSYLWSSPVDAQNLTATTAAANPGSVNGSPETFNDDKGAHWALWHQSLQQATGVSSTLRYKSSTGTGWPGADSFIYATGLPKQGIRGFADPSGSGLWLFWTEGDQGHQTIHYRWNWTGTANNQEAPVPLANAATPQWRSDVINDFASAAPMRKPSTSPFVYTKDPTAFLWTDPRPTGGVGAQVNVVFSGYTARQQNEDICWAAFDQASMNDATQNYGKLTFPRVVNNPVLPATAWDSGGAVRARAGEQLVGDGLRQVFSSRHLDWLISPTFETAALGARDARDPRLYLGLVFRNPPAADAVALYAVSWGPGSYSRARGLYTVTPIFTPLTPGAPALPAGVQTAAGSGILRNPLGPSGASTVPIPVTMQIEPSTGTVMFSGSLFNPANPGDIGAVFNLGSTSGMVAGATLANVVLYADYTPFIFRITTSEAADDSPNAFAEVDSNDPNQLRLVFLWRRSYAQKDTPNFGRTDFLYKTWTLGTQVAAGPISGTPAVAGWTGSGWAGLTAGQTADYTVNPGSGIVTMVADGYRTGATSGVFWLQSAFDGARIQVSYNGGLVEQHRVIGWSQETTAPIDTVQNEGPLRAIPEIYSVSAGGGASMPAVRYWLVWSSPRAIYDLRLAGSNGSVLHQSSDVYLGTIVPRYGAALREQEVDWQNVQQ